MTSGAGLRERINDQLHDDGLVLFTGAGFSRGACSRAGTPVPSSEELVELLWPLAFSGDERDRSELEDVYECAVMRAERETGELLRAHLEVDPASLRDWYRVWFSLPWFRMYTLNIDDLEEAAQKRFDLPPIRPLSALGDELPSRSPELLCIHLNGRIVDYPRITFSHQQYGQRTARPDPWYQHVAADLSSHPVLFVGTQLNEPPLWQQFALEWRDHGARSKRPPSFLVTPRLSRARREVLRTLNVEWVPMDAATFAQEVLDAG